MFSESAQALSGKWDKTNLHHRTLQSIFAGITSLAQVWVLGEKLFHSVAIMPGSIVRPKISGKALETGYDLGSVKWASSEFPFSGIFVRREFD